MHFSSPMKGSSGDTGIDPSLRSPVGPMRPPGSPSRGRQGGSTQRWLGHSVSTEQGVVPSFEHTPRKNLQSSPSPPDTNQPVGWSLVSWKRKSISCQRGMQLPPKGTPSALQNDRFGKHDVA